MPRIPLRSSDQGTTEEKLSHQSPNKQGTDQPVKKLHNDLYVQLVCGLFALLCLPFFLPIFGDEQLWYYGSFFLDLPLLLFAEAVLIVNFVQAESRSHRSFWGWLVLGFSFWLVQSAVDISVLDRTEPSTGIDLLSYFLYFGFYAAIVMALECRPHLRHEKSHRLLLLFDRTGALVFIFGLLLYLTVLPALIDWESYWTSTLILFAVLDLYIFVRLLALRHTVEDRVWRTTFSWMLLASIIWFLTDLAEVLMWTELVPYVESGTPADILWILVFPVVVFSARAGRARGSQDGNPSTVTEESAWEALGMGPIVIYAVAMPLFHLMFYRFGWADPALKSVREILTVVVASGLTLMALVYHQWLRKENKRLADQRADIQGELEHQAFHDALTGLPNRRLFREHLAVGISLARRHKTHCAIFYCDLDEFKIINDSLGHATGDRYLVQIAERLRESVRASDTIARLGGDEFAILVHDIDDEVQILPIAQHLNDALSVPIVLGDSEHVFAASIGIALFPEDGTDEATLLRHADIAMYQAKLKGGNTYQLFAPNMNEAVEQRLIIENGLRTALEDGSLKLLFQPIIDVESRSIVGCEALLRWDQPEHGLVSPDSFIDIAERTGLIVPIGEWVIETVCRLGKKLNRGSGHDLLMAVNISPRQLQQTDFLERVQAILLQTEYPPNRLQLEITESLAIESETTTAVVAELRNLGLSIAIDDLGKGFSSLNRLSDLPVDVVKIDRSFLKMATLDVSGEAIIRAIVAMAQALELHVIAEGIETEEQLNLVQKEGCNSAQGFLFYEPMPEEDLEQLLTNAAASAV